MQIPFSIYDFLGYALPGLIVIVIVIILATAPLEVNQQSPIELLVSSIQKLINPDRTSIDSQDTSNVDSQDTSKDGLAKSLPTTVAQIILYMLVCYLAGFATHGLIDWLFGSLSVVWEPLKRYHSDHGTFEKGLLEPEHRLYPEDFGPYTDQFVHKLKTQIKNVFEIDIGRRGMEKEGNPIKYTEMFHFCRTTVMKQSPTLYPRALALLAQYNSAKLMGAIFFFATFAFFVKIVGFQQGISWIVLVVVCALSCIVRKGSRLRLSYGLVVVSLGLIAWNYKGSDTLVTYYCVSASLCPIFFHLYHVLFRYYRNTILYGFYEHALDLERSQSKPT